ncbi:structure-specific endonuclease subunit MUS81 isoform X2 [Balearica regulorum gibbericeps]|uniref:structure-specific endonuclease subunit MUS81 isoform X2 n=1 Tax=Balearica regulorum gibbericeps TaxID=100784 RepID=UPI003F644A58
MRPPGPWREAPTSGRCARWPGTRCPCARGGRPPSCSTSAPPSAAASICACASIAPSKAFPLAPPLGGGARRPPWPHPHAAPPRDYRPLPHSGAHALLLTLHKSSEPLPEMELLQQAQPLCDRPLTLAAPRGPLGTLLRRDLLQRSGRPPRYSLTPRGQILAQRLAAAALEAPPQASVELLGGEETPLSPSPLSDPEVEFELRPGEFDIILCADITEANGRGPGGGRVPALLRGRVPLLLRRLHVGDFLWVAREKDPPPGRPPRELALDVVVERKAAADLGNSLSDGRYREQKFRLGRCGLRQPVYLLEEPGGGERLPLPLPILRQAAASTQGRVLRAWWGDVAGRGPPEPPGAPCALLPFQRLRSGGGKNQAQTVGDVFARQLLQLGGLSGGRAAAILRRFPTPASLMAAYSDCTDPRQRETLLSTIRCGPLQRNLGPSLSRSLARLYGTVGPLP